MWENEKLSNLYSSLGIVTTHSQDYDGCTCTSVGEISNAYRILMGKHTLKQPIGRNIIGK